MDKDIQINLESTKTKICTKCFVGQPLENFYKCKSKDGKNGECKKCAKERMANYRKNNPELVKECHKKSCKKYYEKNKEKIAKKIKEYRNQKFFKNKNSISTKNRRKNDLNFRISSVLRLRLNNALKGNTKNETTFNLLGCSIEEFRKHLESQFTPKINWENYGLYWHIDHIVECCLFDLSNEKEQKICFHYMNMQPLEASENIRKGQEAREIKKFIKILT